MVNTFSTPRPFAKASILAHAPESSGIFGISNAREWIYISHADNIRRELMHYFEEPGLSSFLPTGFSFEMCGAGHREGRCRQLVRQYSPACRTTEVLA